MIIFSSEVSDQLMRMGFIPVGEVNGFWEFEDSLRLERIANKLIEELKQKN